MPAPPQPPSSKRRGLPVLSLLIIATVFLLPSPSPTLRRSVFTSRVPPRAYATPRNFRAYPFARVCSPPARKLFLRRLTRPTRPLSRVSPPSIAESRNRVLLSAVPHEVGDGLGHRTCILNFEHRLATLLGVTYAHRTSSYGSLTRNAPHAVEKLFNWGAGEVRRDEILERGCADVGYVNDACETPAANIVCRRVRPRSRGGLFDHSVFVPPSVSACLLRRDVDVDRECGALARTFLAAYPEPNTLFQMFPDRCFRDWLFTNFSASSDWLRGKYWAGEVGTGLDARRVQVGMHVRRGDFFNYTHRVLVSDDTFADVLWRVKHALREIVGRDVPVDAHVYSEGVARGRVKDVHDTSAMRRVYVDHEGVARGEEHWKTVLRRHRRAGRGELRVFTHIAEDTVRSVREMIAADVFIGSVSGLSSHVVRVFGRGVMVLPVWRGEVGHELVVPFDWARNGFDSFLDERVLYDALAEVVRRNRLACAVW